MTSPTYAVNARGGRFYNIPSPPLPEPFYGMSVTTALSKGIAAPALKTWGERTVAEYAVDNLDSWTGLDRDSAIDLIKRSPYRTMTGAGNRGTDVHTLCEAIMRGETLGPWALPYTQYIEHFHQWFADWHVQPLHMEHTVVKTGPLGYAGSFDFIADIDGRRVLGDLKTSKGIYPKTGLQLAAYARADWMLSRDGQSCVPMPEVDELGVLHLTETGYGWYPILADTDTLHDTFLNVLEVANFELETSREVLSKKPFPPPRRDEHRAALVERLREVIGWGGGADLAANWPHSIPTLKASQEHTTPMLDAIDHMVTRIEHRHRPKPPVATVDRHDQAATALLLLDADVYTTVQKYAVAAGVPNLKSHQATGPQLDLLEQLITIIGRVPDVEDRAARIGRVTKGRTTNPAELTPLETAAFMRTRATKQTTKQGAAA